MWKTEIVEKWKTLRKQAACCGNTVDKKNMINKGDNGFFHNFHIWWKSGKHTMWKLWKTSDFYTSKKKKTGNECLKALLFNTKVENRCV